MRRFARQRLPVLLLALLTILQMGSGCALFFPTPSDPCIEFRNLGLTRQQRRYIKRHTRQVGRKDCYRRRHYPGFDILKGYAPEKRWYLYDFATKRLRMLPLTIQDFQRGIPLEPLPGPLLDSIGGRHDSTRVYLFKEFLQNEAKELSQ